MADSYSRNDGRRPTSRALLAAVGLGMVLFISGFVLAVTSLSDPDSVSASDGGPVLGESSELSTSYSLMIGLLLSLAGVVLATAGPAMYFIHERRESA